MLILRNLGVHLLSGFCFKIILIYNIPLVSGQGIPQFGTGYFRPFGKIACLCDKEERMLNASRLAADFDMNPYWHQPVPGFAKGCYHILRFAQPAHGPDWPLGRGVGQDARVRCVHPIHCTCTCVCPHMRVHTQPHLDVDTRQ